MKQVTAVILAAGQSKRMGEAKLLLPWGETTILAQTIQHTKAAAVDDLLLVSGGYQAEVETIAQAHAVPFVHNPQFATGEMLSSLKTAVHFLQRQRPLFRGAILVMLGDLPFLEPDILNVVIEAYKNGRGRLIAPTYQGKRGHPVLIDAQFFTELLALPAAGAPRDLIRNHQEALYLVEVGSDVILRDIDTPEQYERWRPSTSHNNGLI